MSTLLRRRFLNRILFIHSLAVDISNGGSPAKPDILEATRSADMCSFCAKTARIMSPFNLLHLSSLLLWIQEWVSHTLGEDPKRAHTLWKWLYRNHHWAAGPDDMEGTLPPYRHFLQVHSTVLCYCAISAYGIRAHSSHQRYDSFRSWPSCPRAVRGVGRASWSRMTTPVLLSLCICRPLALCYPLGLADFVPV